MKTNFRKLALAGSVAALAGASIPAQAIIVGAPGEAALVPFAVYTTGETNWDFNTLVRVTVPSQLGNDVIQNCYTAPHVSPGNTAAQGCNVVATGPELPSELTSSTTKTIHWYFLDQKSVHRLNGTFDITADDTYLFDWRAKASGQLPGYIGYLLFVNETAANGGAAQFAFNTDAYLTFELDGTGTDEYSDEIVWMPSLPMADGADAGATGPTLSNNVVEWQGGQLVLDASPLVTGERTIWADGVVNNYVFDLPLAINQAESVVPAPATDNHDLKGGILRQGTIAVVWNDRNVGAAWNGMVAYRYNNDEKRCSGNISLPDELNLLYIPAQTQEGTASADGDAFADFPGTWNDLKQVSPYAASSSEAGASYAATTTICNTKYDGKMANVGVGLDSPSNYGIDGGFVKIVAVEPADPATFTPEGAAVMFSFPVFTPEVGTNFGEFAGWPTGQTMLGHSRGAFSIIN